MGRSKRQLVDGQTSSLRSHWLDYPPDKHNLSRVPRGAAKLSSRGFSERTLGESVRVSYFCSMAFDHVMFVAYRVTNLTLLVLLF